MCTLSWHHRKGGYAVFFNRDERIGRLPEIAPALRERGTTRFLAPLDGDFEGTWIATNERGLTLCLLNGPASGEPAPAARASRGEVPLALIDCASTALVRLRLAAFDLQRYRPFALVGFDPGGSGLVAVWHGRRLSFEDLPREPPLVSSSFCTEEVRANRVSVYRGILSRPGTNDATELHLRFHESHVPRRGPHSTCMHRSDASTVSFTWIEVGIHETRLRYVTGPPCAGRPSGAPLVLARREGDDQDPLGVR